MTLTFLDTDVLIRLANRKPEVVDAAERLGGVSELATSSINVAEFLRGFPPELAAEAMRRIAGVTEVPFGPRAARRFAATMHALDRAGAPLHSADGMVAAVALEDGGRLWTRNGKHFSRIAGLALVEP